MILIGQHKTIQHRGINYVFQNIKGEMLCVSHRLDDVPLSVVYEIRAIEKESYPFAMEDHFSAAAGRGW